jgi:hypothetical protein
VRWCVCVCMRAAPLPAGRQPGVCAWGGWLAFLRVACVGSGPTQPHTQPPGRAADARASPSRASARHATAGPFVVTRGRQEEPFRRGRDAGGRPPPPIQRAAARPRPQSPERGPPAQFFFLSSHSTTTHLHALQGLAILVEVQLLGGPDNDGAGAAVRVGDGGWESPGRRERVERGMEKKAAVAAVEASEERWLAFCDCRSAECRAPSRARTVSPLHPPQNSPKAASRTTGRGQDRRACLILRREEEAGVCVCERGAAALVVAAETRRWRIGKAASGVGPHGLGRHVFRVDDRCARLTPWRSGYGRGGERARHQHDTERERGAGRRVVDLPRRCRRPAARAAHCMLGPSRPTPRPLAFGSACPAAPAHIQASSNSPRRVRAVCMAKTVSRKTRAKTGGGSPQEKEETH